MVGGGLLSERLGGGVRLSLQNPTLFMTKSCDFPYLFRPEKPASSKKTYLPSSRLEFKSHTLLMTKMAKIYTLLMTTTPFGTYERVPPLVFFKAFSFLRWKFKFSILFENISLRVHHFHSHPTCGQSYVGPSSLL